VSSSSSGSGNSLTSLTSLLASLLPVTQNGSGSSQGSTSGSTTVQRNFTPEQQEINAPLFDLVQGLMTDPASYVAPFQEAARNQVNDDYSGVADSLRQQFLSTGGGSSGKYGLALSAANNGRLQSLADTDSTFKQTEAQLPVTAAGLASNLLNENFGQTTNTSGSSSSATQTQQQKQTGSPLGDAATGALGALFALL
jgi:hypothetical protein